MSCFTAWSDSSSRWPCSPSHISSPPSRFYGVVGSFCDSLPVLPARPPSPMRASIPVSSLSVPAPVPTKPPLSAASISIFVSPVPASVSVPIGRTPRIVSNLKLVVFPNPYREDPGKALRNWDLWGPFFFIVFLRLTLSWSASVKKGGFSGGSMIFNSDEALTQLGPGRPKE